MAQNAPDKFHLVKEIADQVDVPAAYLSKVMKSLGKRGIIKTRRGAHGGVAFLSQNIGRYSFYDICKLLEDPAVLDLCLISKRNCNAKKPCSSHAKWSCVRSDFIDLLKESKIC